MPDTSTVVLAGPDSTLVSMVEEEVTVVVPSEGDTVVVATGTTGPQGDPGVSAAQYVHVQAVAAQVWTVPHNLNRIPSVSVRTTAGDWVEAEYDHPTLNTTLITFGGATGGTAYLD